MSAAQNTTGQTSSGVRCIDCDARLAHDQRYCVECGARRGPLPAQIAQLIGAIHERGPTPGLDPAHGLAGALTEAQSKPRRSEFVMPGPRATAVAVMGMLAFGVIIGSLAGGASVETLASAPLIVVGLSHPAPAVQVAASDSGAADDGSGAAVAPAATTTPAATQQDPQASASPSTSSTPTTSTPTPNGNLPPVKHVFMIMLSDRGFAHGFGSTGGYLNGALRRQGELVQNYYAVAGAPLANEIALISGQGPTAETAADCPVFSRIRPAHKGSRGQVIGTGCVYPATTKTLAGQLTAAGHSWKGYLQGVSGTACRMPRLGSHVAQTASAHTEYLAWRNPFLYFRSLTSGTTCKSDEAGLPQLAKDLKSETSTPSFSYIVPAPCADGSEAPCRRGATPGLAGANRFLKSVVPEIKRSPAYKDGGLIAITFDQAPQTGADADPSGCCSNPTYPNLRRLPAGSPAVPPAAMGVTTGTTTTTSTTTGTDTAPTDTTGTTTTTTGTDATTTTTTGTDTTTTGTDTTTTGTDTTTTGTDTTTTGTDTTTIDTTGTTTPTSLGDGETTPTGGGGQVGLLLVSSYVKRDSIDVIDYYNHFSLLATIEDLFGLHRLGYAGAPGLSAFGLGVFNNYAG